MKYETHMLLSYKLKIMKRIVYITSFFFLLAMLLIEAFGYKIAVLLFGNKGELDFVIVVLIIVTLGIVFIIDFIKDKFEWLFLRIFVTSVIIMMSMAIYILSNFYFTNRLSFYDTPYNERLLFVSTYVEGGLHHQRYETTVYINVAPMTYQALEIIENLDTFIQDNTIDDSSWFNIEFYPTYFIIYVTDYIEGDMII